MWDRLLVLAVLIAGCGAALAEQQCNNRIAQSTPTFRFVLSADGTATDRRTGLVWLRCPLGFTIDDAGTPDNFADDACRESNAELFDWQAALLAAGELNGGGGFDDWRVPNVKELMSLVERQCIRPAVNTRVFPALPRDGFWSSTTYNQTDRAAMVDFGTGHNDQAQKTSTRDSHYVRPVRED